MAKKKKKTSTQIHSVARNVDLVETAIKSFETGNYKPLFKKGLRVLARKI